MILSLLYSFINIANLLYIYLQSHLLTLQLFSKLTFYADERRFEVHFQIRKARLHNIKILIIDANVAFWSSWTVTIDDIFDVSVTSNKSPIVH